MPRQQPPAAHLPTSADDAEAQFYDALREADLDKLMALWADDDDVVCVHPGGPRNVGPRAIRAAFEALFSEGRVNAQAERVRRVNSADAAVHSVVERVEVLTERGPRTAWVLATNVYVRTALGWRIVAHHASPGSAEAAQEAHEAPSVLH